LVCGHHDPSYATSKFKNIGENVPFMAESESKIGENDSGDVAESTPVLETEHKQNKLQRGWYDLQLGLL